MIPDISEKRRTLAAQRITQERRWRILFVGRSVNGSTDVVSCLYRALVNLGHHVLNLDTKLHRDAIDNPHRLQGGQGPIYIKLSYIRPILDRFRPQVIVLCAGGLTFTPEALDALRARGIVLIGLTLSDPDVFPGVSTYAGAFDFHTTNARQALAMYEAAGVHNTLYFPFGIDRGFVTQPVPRAPDLAADVICLGHARPERVEVMTRLAERFDVRTYGRGWNLPRSEIVEGMRMLQASREGRIHVNFPGTRAGHVNVKCGVFETIGNGALLCTGIFPEMERFFEYGSEIIGYDGHEDLAEQIDRILRDPELYGSMVRRAFDRLVSEHLYEHRWITLFREIDALLADPPAWLADRAPAIRETLSRSLPRAKRVIVSGFYGAANLGDELILRSISDAIHAADPAAQVVVAAENPRAVEAEHGLQSFSRRDHAESASQTKTASAVVLGGGGLWHDHTFQQSGGLLGLFQGAPISIAGLSVLPLLGSMRGVPFFVTGMGVGPLESKDARGLVRFMAERASEIVVRDRESKALLDAVLGGRGQAAYAPDVVYALDLAERVPLDDVAELASGGRSLVGISVRKWTKEGGAEALIRIAAALDRIAQERPIAVVGVPMQLGPTHDVAAIEAVFAAMSEDCPRLCLPQRATAAQVLWTLDRCDALLGMRLHACLLAHRLGTPAVGVAYDGKVANHFAQIGRSAFCHPLAAPAEAVAESVLRCLSRGGSLPLLTRLRIQRLEAASAARLRKTARRIASVPASDGLHEIPERPPAAQTMQEQRKDPAGLTAAAVTPVLRRAESSMREEGRPLATRHRLGAGLAALQIDERDPRAGEWAALEFSLPGSPTQGFALSFAIATPGAHRGSAPRPPAAGGRIRYELHIDDAVALVQDMEAWEEKNEVRVYSKAKRELSLKVVVRLLRNVHPSSRWSILSCVRLEGLSIRPVTYNGPLEVRVSSPHCRVLDAKAICIPPRLTLPAAE